MKGPLIGQGRTAEIFAWDDGQVVKLFRPNWPVEWIESEARIVRAVSHADVNAPRAGEVVEVDGRKGILCERIDGRTMLDTIGAKPWAVRALARQFAGLHVAMHRRTRLELPSQRNQLTRMICAAPVLPDATKKRVLEMLNRLPDGNAICHGDFHPGNILLSTRGPVVIDWMSATRGSPTADVTSTALLFQLATLPPGLSAVTRASMQVMRRVFASTYLQEYHRLRPLDDVQMAMWKPILAAARLSTQAPRDEEERLVALIDAAVGA